MNRTKLDAVRMSVVVTVKNDPEGEKRLRNALSRQTKKPDEVIIIRAEEHGNCTRAQGRNIGIQKATHDVIAVTDVGCVPHPDWLERLTAPIAQSLSHSGASLRATRLQLPSATADGGQVESRSYRPALSRRRAGLQDDQSIVVAGFYRVIAKTPLQQAIAPYLGVSFDQRTERYLPASRSIAFTKHAWDLVGGYPETARSGAEDLVFASRLAKHPAITVLQAPDALVDWEPPSTIGAFFRDIVKHTKGNLETRYWRHLVKNASVLFRWLVFFWIPWLIPVYLLWPVTKHRSRVNGRARLLLPFVQLIADTAVIYALLR